jgi:hypothetical protein
VGRIGFIAFDVQYFQLIGSEYIALAHITKERQHGYSKP